jgi:hypothetical protein
MSSQEQTQEEFMTACLADGTAREVCENRWKAAHEVNPSVTPQPTSPADASTDADLLRKCEMLEARVALREKQLKQAIDIAGRANDERKAKEEAEKQSLINSIMIDSKFNKDELAPKSLAELQTMRFTLDRSLQQTFANIAADIDEKNRKKQPRLTAGYYDKATDSWKGGM